MYRHHYRDTTRLLFEKAFKVFCSTFCAYSTITFLYFLVPSDMLAYGCTRLEIGVQSVYEDVARDTNRGHTVRAVMESFQMSKDAGFKVVTHMMPDLPNVGMERDTEQFIVSQH